MFKIIMATLTAIVIFARATELDTPPLLAVALGSSIGVVLYMVYDYWDKREREYEKQCRRERRLNAVSVKNGGVCQRKRINQITYARYVQPHSAANRVANELQSEKATKVRYDSVSPSKKKPMRKVIGMWSYGYCLLDEEDRRRVL